MEAPPRPTGRKQTNKKKTADKQQVFFGILKPHNGSCTINEHFMFSIKQLLFYPCEMFLAFLWFLLECMLVTHKRIRPSNYNQMFLYRRRIATQP